MEASVIYLYNGFTDYYVCKHMRQEVQIYVTIKLKGLNQKFEESDEGDRQMGFLVVITIKYLQLN